ncbi:uncharacterized protein PHALS_12486 [Plasmopara halstedii]|uniref:Uncharacterized protein n=1 Tax=Plasmopara halstedii TaxID=4781 RepID=A0A0P1AN19_PLAHL|nr:uncharacterized protein PHALS_12486 [Plasmopara halstedii]CEG42191.1 hypothetical protein PHALS_12486 [Plasmopara halstedii]|eukprot:XP_024578560.1 hypothetical protein PHALS_12486 [Plasmopara halstedii]
MSDFNCCPRTHYTSTLQLYFDINVDGTLLRGACGLEQKITTLFIIEHRDTSGDCKASTVIMCTLHI